MGKRFAMRFRKAVGSKLPLGTFGKHTRPSYIVPFNPLAAVNPWKGSTDPNAIAMKAAGSLIVVYA
jgi:hypothetical protein